MAGSVSPGGGSPGPDYKEQLYNNIEFCFDVHVRSFLEKIIEGGALEVSLYEGDESRRTYTLRKTKGSPANVKLHYTAIMGIFQIPIEVKIPDVVHYKIIPGVCMHVKDEESKEPIGCTVKVPLFGDRSVEMKLISMEGDATDKKVHNLILEHGEESFVAPTHKLDEIKSTKH